MESDKHLLHVRARARVQPPKKNLFPSTRIGRDSVIEEGFSSDTISNSQKYLSALPSVESHMRSRRLKHM